MVGSLNKLPKSPMTNFLPLGFPENGPNLHFIFSGKGFPNIFKNYYHHDPSPITFASPKQSWML